MKSMNKKVLAVSLLAGCLCGTGAAAGEVGPLTTFVAGTPAKAAEVNGNFSAVTAAVNGNAADIANNSAGSAMNAAAISAINEGMPGLEWTTISKTGVDVSSAVNMGQVTLTAPSAGFVIVRFDGMACPSTGDRVVLAASNSSAHWAANDGAVAVYGDGNTPCYPFAHTRVYAVSQGDTTFYAVAQNYVQTAGNGKAGVYATLTAQFYANRY